MGRGMLRELLDLPDVPRKVAARGVLVGEPGVKVCAYHVIQSAYLHNLSPFRTHRGASMAPQPRADHPLLKRGSAAPGKR